MNPTTCANCGDTFSPEFEGQAECPLCQADSEWLDDEEEEDEGDDGDPPSPSNKVGNSRWILLTPTDSSAIVNGVRQPPDPNQESRP